MQLKSIAGNLFQEIGLIQIQTSVQVSIPNSDEGGELEIEILIRLQSLRSL